VPLSGGRHAVVGFSLGEVNSTVTRLEIADALAGAVAVAVLAGIGLPLVRASLAPLRQIEVTAAAIAAGDLSRRIDHPVRDTEVGRLADALDAMLGRIEAAYQARAEGEARALRSEDRMRQFVADASHELRTPLTSVSGLAEFGLQQGDAASPGERFYRTDGARSRARGGTGLGLSIAASLAAAHGGDITVDTKPGEGAAFHVRLPLAASVDGDRS
jgi:two-component system OmpR family sensor kinase